MTCLELLPWFYQLITKKLPSYYQSVVCYWYLYLIHFSKLSFKCITTKLGYTNKQIMTIIQVSYLPPSLWSALTWKYLLQSLLCKMHFSIFVVPLLLDEWRRVMIYLAAAAAAQHWVGVASVRSHKQDRVLEQRCGRGVGREPAADSLSVSVSVAKTQHHHHYNTTIPANQLRANLTPWHPGSDAPRLGVQRPDWKGPKEQSWRVCEE